MKYHGGLSLLDFSGQLAICSTLAKRSFRTSFFDFWSPLCIVLAFLVGN